MQEQAYTFGNLVPLVGIYTNGTKAATENNTPTVMFLNSGLLHRAGPFRLYVDLARKLSVLGFPVFRFDLSGIGDSEKHRDNRSREEQILSDIKEAMDFLAMRKDAQRFVVMGLCTGADNAHKISVRDERICGAVFLDGYCYPSAGYYLRLYGPKLLNPAVWWRAVKRTVLKPTSQNDELFEIDKQREDNNFWKLPAKNKTKAELEMLVNRSVNLLYIYTGSNNLVNYRNQMAASMKSIKFGNQLQEEYLKDSEHTYPLSIDRNKMMGIICKWMQEKYSKGFDQY